MQKFVTKHAAATTGTLSCFDRLLFKGHLPLGYPHAMEQFLTHRRVLMKDLKTFVLQQATRLKAHAAAAAGWQWFDAKAETARANAGRLAIAAEKEIDHRIDLALLLANEAVGAPKAPKNLAVQNSLDSSEFSGVMMLVWRACGWGAPRVRGRRVRWPDRSSDRRGA
jgi:hypothetical protein